jgi:hypothetical protein
LQPSAQQSCPGAQSPCSPQAAQLLLVHTPPSPQSAATQQSPALQAPLQHRIPSPHWPSAVQAAHWLSMQACSPAVHSALEQQVPVAHAPPQQRLPAPHWSSRVQPRH